MLGINKLLGSIIILGIAIVTGWIVYALIVVGLYWLIRGGADLFWWWKDKNEY